MSASDRTAMGRARSIVVRMNTGLRVRLQPRRLVWAALAVGLSGAAVASAPASQAKATATAPSSAAIDAVVTKAASVYMADPQTVGLSIGVVRAGNTRRYHLGVADRAAGKAPTDATLYAIGSLTKTFAGALMAQAAIAHTLALDDDIRRHLDGEYPNLLFEGRPIRLADLLNHRSGLPRFLPVPPAGPPGEDGAAANRRDEEFIAHASRADFYAALHQVTLTSAPGRRFEYSNAAAQLAGYILERLGGASFETLVKDKLAAPLGMRDTTITLTADQRPRLAAGYDEKGARQAASPDQFQAAGALRSTLADMLEYAHWQLDPNDQVARLTHVPTYTNEDYAVGLNWQIVNSGSRQVIFQDGAVPGFASLCILQPQLDLAVVILSNELGPVTLDRLSAMANQIMSGIDARSVAKP